MCAAEDPAAAETRTCAGVFRVFGGCTSSGSSSDSASMTGLAAALPFAPHFLTTGLAGVCAAPRPRLLERVTGPFSSSSSSSVAAASTFLPRAASRPRLLDLAACPSQPLGSCLTCAGDLVTPGHGSSTAHAQASPLSSWAAQARSCCRRCVERRSRPLNEHERGCEQASSAPFWPSPCSS